MRGKRLLCMVLGVILLVGSGFIGGYTFRSNNAEEHRSQDQSKEMQKYSLLAKRLFIDQPNDSIINFAPLRDEFNKYLQPLGARYSVYFEYLPTGTSIRSWSDENGMVGASLLKLPVSLNLYRASELGLLEIDTPYPIQKEWLNSEFGTLYQKGAGYQLTLRQAAKIMLTESDNTAATMIIAYLIDAHIPLEEQALNAVDVDIQVTADKQGNINAREYASLLKCLYFSCYVNYDNSQEILKYLTESNFNDRLTAKLPEQIMVAHKIGTYTQLKVNSDCGVVYVPKRNYVICIMLEESDPAASGHIADISKMAYDYVVSQ